VGLNRFGGMVLSPLRLLYIVRYRSLRQVNPSSRGVVPSVVCLECDCKALTMRRPWPTRAAVLWGGGSFGHYIYLVIFRSQKGVHEKKKSGNTGVAAVFSNSFNVGAPL
jgi:hypothetical protein